MIDLPSDPNQLSSRLVIMQAALAAKFDQMHALAKISSRINEGAMLGEILDQIYEHFQSMIPFTRLGMALVDVESDRVHIVWARSQRPIKYLGPGYSATLKGSTLETVLRSKEPRIIADLPAYFAAKPSSESTRLAIQEGVRSSFTCPLYSFGKPLGLLFFSSENLNAYNNQHADLFMHLAGELGILLDRCLLYQKVVESTKTKGHMLGLLLHDMRGPLTALRGYLQLLDSRQLGELTLRQEQAVAVMARASQSLIEVLNDAVEIETINHGHLEIQTEPTDLALFLKTQSEGWRAAAALKSITFELDLGSLPIVKCDSRRLKQALENYVTNAIKFSNSGTTITLNARADDGKVILTVIDQGQGIPKNELHGLFRPFKKTSVRPTAGEVSTGLGLAIVKRIAEAHKGTVSVESEEGKGSSFSIAFPVRDL